MKPVQCVDLFCGAGGTGEGVLQAFQEYGVPCKMIGINHWKIAVQTNKFNHKEGHFYCATIDAVDPCEVAGNEPIDFLLASPECTHHSQARGGKPRSNQSRCQPELLINWVRKALVKRMFVENVPEFLSWGPLLVTDTKINNRLYLAGTPDPRKKGVFFKDWVRSLQVSGYEVDWRILNAADYGAPTTRVRLIVQAVRKGCGLYIQWPEPTHTMEGTEGKKKWVTAKTIIDWNIRGTSIFERKKPLAVNTLRRIYSGIAKHGGRYADRFGVALRREIVRSCKFSGRCPFDVLASLPSISTNGREGLVTTFVTRYNGGDDRNHSVSAPVPVVDCSNRYGLVEPFVFATGQTSAGACSTSISAPISTVVTKAEHCIVEPMFIPQHSGGTVKPVSHPLPTIATTGSISVISPMLVKFYGSEEDAHSVGKPLGTVTCKDRFALADGRLVVNEQGQFMQLDILFRMLQPHELATAMSFPKSYKFAGTKSDQVKQIGNAVCPSLAKALMMAVLPQHFPKLAGMEESA